jgi:hypothetical protein
MNVEERLRDAFALATHAILPEMIRPCPVPQRRLSRRRLRISGGSRGRALVPLAAGGAVALMLAGVSLTVSLAVNGSHQDRTADGGAGAPASAAPPRYAVIATDQTSASLTVWDIQTGRITARIKPPQRTPLFNMVAGTSDDREFITTTRQPNGCDERLYRLRLDGGGRLASLAPLPIQPPQDVSLFSLTVSADGRVIAYAGRLRCGPGRAEIGVINTANGQIRTWPGGAGSLSLSADGRALGFLQSSPASSSPAVTQTARVMRTDAPAGPADQRSHVVLRGTSTGPLNLAGESPVVISADGSEMFACTEDDRPVPGERPVPAGGVHSPGARGGRAAGDPASTPVVHPGGQPGRPGRLTGRTPVTLRLYDTATSRQLRILDTWRHPLQGCNLAPDASGPYLLVNSPPALGWVHLPTGQMRPWWPGFPPEISAIAW